MPREHVRAAKYEAEDMMNLLELANSDKIIDDELTRGRIRSIYVRVKYGQASARNVAEYYNVPEEFIQDIVKGKIFADITQGR